MKLTSLALFAAFVVAGYAEAQTPQQPAQAPGEQAPAHHPLSGACRTEVSKLCGSSHGKEMTSCIRGNLDTNKFSSECQGELKEHLKQAAKPPA